MKLAGLLLALLVVLWLVFGDHERTDDLLADDGRSAEFSDSAAPNEAAPSREKEIRFIDGNAVVEDYGVEGGTVGKDLEALRDVVGDCQLLIKDFDRFHLPGNPEIVKFLQGGNRDGLAWIPGDFSFLNEEGELMDRFGTPVFFHRLSGMRFEFRSAGPDRKMWNDDDVVVK